MEAGAGIPDLGPKGVGWVVLQFIGLLCVLASPLWRMGLDDGPRVIALVSGVLMLLSGGLLLIRSFQSLGKSLTALPAPLQKAELVTDGPYRLTRHPIYGALILLTFGWALAWTSAVGLVAAAATTVVLFLKSLKEEAWLVEKFPDYPAYRARTRRFMPVALRKSRGA
jgi:protein-S-isoprenylcysteine O-methyltransferase Ste14